MHLPTVYNKMSCGPKQFLGKERFSKGLYQPFEMKTHFGIFPVLVVLPLAVTTALEVGRVVAPVICGNPVALPLICDCVIIEEDPYIAGNIQ